MNGTILLQVVFISLVVATFPHYAVGKVLGAAVPCPSFNFECTNGKCTPPGLFCNGKNDCGDNSDEMYCNVDASFRCPAGWTSCPNKRRCILSAWMCDGRKHCPVVSEETICAKKVGLMNWFLGRRKSGSRSDRWGSQLHRTAVALHLANNSIFVPGNMMGEEIRYELAIQLTRRLAKDKKMPPQELALYIHSLLVACMDPRDFYGDDLVRELRRRVETSGNYTNPFLILVLCNAGDAMSNRDVERVTAAYSSHQRPFWIDSQALSTMALSCIASRGGVSMDERTLKDMLQELKRRQFLNGTVDNLRTTAIVAQALLIYDSYEKDFDMDSAVKVLMDGINGTESLLTAYYALPALYHKSLLNVSSTHCSKEPIKEEEELQKLLDIDGETMKIQYSVWIGDEINLARTWQLKMRVNSTIYDVIETVAKIDNRQKVDYNVVNGKPYVASLNGKEDDAEMGIFWFVYLKTPTFEDPEVVEESPVDIKLKPNQEVILWYKRGSWNAQNLVKNVTSS